MILQKNYKTFLTEELNNTASGEIEIKLGVTPTSDTGYLIVEPGVNIQEESIFYHRKVGASVFAYGVNRDNPIFHTINSQVYLASSIDVFNHLFQFIGEQGFIFKKTTQDVIIKGGTFYLDSENITIADVDTSLRLTNKTLTVNSINYIHIRNGDYFISSTQDISYLLATITIDAGGTIINITRKNVYGIGTENNLEDIALPTYTITGGSTDRSIDLTNTTFNELANVVKTLIQDIETGLVGPQGPQGPAGPVGSSAVVTIASASTVNLAATTIGNIIHITGNTTINGWGTVVAGASFTIIFDGALILIHNAVSNILPTGANIPTAIGDTMELISEGAGNWRVIDYQKISGYANLLQSTTITGEIRMWTTDSAPSGWLICDGSAVDRTTYSALFAVIGTTFGIGNGSTTFNLPNLKNRVVMGRDTIAKTVIDTADAAWTAGSDVVATNDTGDKKEGTSSVKLAVAAGAIANQILGYKAIGSTSFAGKTTVGFWIKSDIALASGDLRYQLDDTAALASPIESINIPALVANQWTKVYLTLATPHLDTAIISHGIYQVVDKGAFNLWVDDFAYGENYETGSLGGEKTHTIKTEEMPSHNHTYNGSSGGALTGLSVATATNCIAFTTSSTGGGLATNILQPYITLNYIIAQ